MLLQSLGSNIYIQELFAYLCCFGAWGQIHLHELLSCAVAELGSRYINKQEQTLLCSFGAWEQIHLHELLSYAAVAELGSRYINTGADSLRMLFRSLGADISTRDSLLCCCRAWGQIHIYTGANPLVLFWGSGSDTSTRASLLCGCRAWEQIHKYRS